jgi:hypothetical protein
MKTYWDSSIIKYGADELLTLDDSGFASLNLSLQVAAP